MAYIRFKSYYTILYAQSSKNVLPFTCLPCVNLILIKKNKKKLYCNKNHTLYVSLNFKIVLMFVMCIGFPIYHLFYLFGKISSYIVIC